MCHPDVIYQISKCAQVQDPKQEDAKYPNQAIKQLQDQTIAGLMYQKRDPKSAKL